MLIGIVYKHRYWKLEKLTRLYSNVDNERCESFSLFSYFLTTEFAFLSPAIQTSSLSPTYNHYSGLVLHALKSKQSRRQKKAGRQQQRSRGPPSPGQSLTEDELRRHLNGKINYGQPTTVERGGRQSIRKNRSKKLMYKQWCIHLTDLFWSEF